MGKKLLKIHDVDFTKDTVEFKWYTVLTQFNWERKAAQFIEARFHSMNASDKFGEILVPILEEEITTPKGRKRKVSTNVLDSGYIFVKMVMNNDTWNIVRQTPGVRGWLNADGKPGEVPQENIDNIKKMLGLDKKEKEEKIEKFNGIVGDTVEVVSGLFAGKVGKIVEINSDRVRVIENETQIPMEFDIESVKVI